MIVMAMPESTMLRGIIRFGSWTSCPTIDEISSPENAKHSDDQKLIESIMFSRGSSFEGANEVALPVVASAIAPHAMRITAGIHVAMLPRCCTHLPAEDPSTLMNVISHRKPRTKVTEYARLSA